MAYTPVDERTSGGMSKLPPKLNIPAGQQTLLPKPTSDKLVAPLLPGVNISKISQYTKPDLSIIQEIQTNPQTFVADTLRAIPRLSTKIQLGVSEALGGQSTFEPSTPTERFFLGNETINSPATDVANLETNLKQAGVKNALPIALALTTIPEGLNFLGLGKNKVLKEATDLVIKQISEGATKDAVLQNIEKQFGKSVAKKIETNLTDKTIVQIAKTGSLPELPKLTTERINENPLIQEARKYKSAEEFVKAQGTPVYHGTTKDFADAIATDGFKVGTENIRTMGMLGNVKGKAKAIFFSDDIRLAKKFGENRADVLEKELSEPITAFIDPKANILDLTKLDNKTIDVVDDLIKKMKAPDGFAFADDAEGLFTGSSPIGGGRTFRQLIKDGEIDVGRDIAMVLDSDSFTKALKEAGYDGVRLIEPGKKDFGLKGNVKSKTTAILNPNVLKTKSQLTDIWNKAQEMPISSKVVSPAKTPDIKIPQKPPLGISQEELARSIPQKTTIPVSEDPVKAVIDALQGAKSVRKTQETLYSQERSKRLGQALAVGKNVSGEKGFYAQLGKLKGELPKVDFESLRGKIKQGDIDALFNQVEESTKLSGFEKITTKGALAKLFGEMGGKVPTEGELKLLGQVFPKELISVLLDKRTLWQKAKDIGINIINVPRSIMASFDLSAPLRQGVFFLGRKEFWKSFGSMFRAFGSEKSYQAIMESIASKPTYELMKESKLALTDIGQQLTGREEQFMSNYAEKIPLAGIAIRASGRAYTGFLNKVRADVFENLINKAEKVGLDPQNNIDLSKEIAKFVNSATGRGNLGQLERAATTLNGFFFSPRLMASRLTLLNPIYYVKADPFVRKEAVKSLLSFAGAITTVLGLAKAGGASVNLDPRNSDFGKIKIGNTRVDIMGGFQQYIRMAAQLLTGKYVSSTTGKISTLGEGYKPITRFDILLRQLESKEAPVVSFVTSLLKQQDYAGLPIDVKNEIASRFYPMVIASMVDLYKEDPAQLPLGALGIFGVGLQTYKLTKPVKSKGLPALPKFNLK